MIRIAALALLLVTSPVHAATKVKASVYTLKTKTATGTVGRMGIIAVSPSLFKKGWTFGKRVRLHGAGIDGVFVIADRMPPKAHPSVDIWHPLKSEAMKFGSRWVTADLLD